jgi:hypothetical protein
VGLCASFVIIANILLLKKRGIIHGASWTIVLTIALMPQFSSFTGYQSLDYVIKGWQFYSQDMAQKDSYAMSTGRNRFFTKNAEVFYAGSNGNVDQTVWNFTFGASPEIKLENKPVHGFYTNQLANQSDMPPIVIVYAKKQGLVQDAYGISAVFYDKNGRVLREVGGRSEKHSGDLIFIPDSPVSGVDRIDFVGRDGGMVDLRPDFYIGVEKYDG